MPLGEDTLDVYLYWLRHKAGVEGFRVGAYGGIVGAHEGDGQMAVLRHGWLLGVGVSGEFGDDPSALAVLAAPAEGAR